VITGRTRPWVHLTEPNLAMPNGMAEIPPSPLTGAADAEIHNLARTLGFASALCLVVVRFGMLHELFTYAFHAHLYLPYLFGIPALLALVASGGIRRVFQGKAAYFWTAYTLWMFAAVPFSSWRGGSFDLAFKYLRSEYVVFLAIAGLAVTWGECKTMLRAIAWSGVGAMLIARYFQSARFQAQSRLSLEFGTIADPNDFACVLLLLLPLMLWLGLGSKSGIVRLVLFPALPYGVYVILSTGSRGGLVGLLAEAALFLCLGTMRQRVALLILGAVIVPVTVAALPRQTLRRITSFSQEEAGGEDAGAVGSRATRQYMLRKSIEDTLKYPIFGVGPGQMVSFEGGRSKTSSSPGVWQNAHNVWLQASSECGIPALIFFVGGVVSTWRRLKATHRKARARPDCADIRTAVFCVMVGMGGFLAAATFLNFAYLFYAPALGALAIVISPAAAREFETRSAGAGQGIASVQRA
jgi:O-antigen ligase